MKTCVIGGNGYLGHHVTKYFNADSLSRKTGFDVTTPNLKERLNKYDVVIHMGALVDKSEKQPEEVFRVNADGTRNIVKYLNPNQIFIFTSTKEVHTPSDSYGLSKLIGEEYIKYFSKHIGFRSGIFRLSSTYAPPTNGSSFVNYFVRTIKEEGDLSLLMKGKQMRDFLYVDDLSRAFEAFINSNVKSQTYEIGGGRKNSATILGLVKIIEEITGKKAKINFSDKQVIGQLNYITDLQDIKSELDWKPKIGIKEGIKKIA